MSIFFFARFFFPPIPKMSKTPHLANKAPTSTLTNTLDILTSKLDAARHQYKVAKRLIHQKHLCHASSARTLRRDLAQALSYYPVKQPRRPHVPPVGLVSLLKTPTDSRLVAPEDTANSHVVCVFGAKITVLADRVWLCMRISNASPDQSLQLAHMFRVTPSLLLPVQMQRSTLHTVPVGADNLCLFATCSLGSSPIASFKETPLACRYRIQDQWHTSAATLPLWVDPAQWMRENIDHIAMWAPLYYPFAINHVSMPLDPDWLTCTDNVHYTKDQLYANGTFYTTDKSKLTSTVSDAPHSMSSRQLRQLLLAWTDHAHCLDTIVNDQFTMPSRKHQQLFACREHSLTQLQSLQTDEKRE
ncbi:hypothetical protein BC940DRAFT_351348 [Gongronella butleri]|nr:hypothetical protein BC940DRAFT_351348 [Gongronella butleri]